MSKTPETWCEPEKEREMSEDEKEEMIRRLWDEFAASIGAAATNEKKFAFIAGARAALHEVSPETSPSPIHGR
jgi:hypothetical protein